VDTFLPTSLSHSWPPPTRRTDGWRRRARGPSEAAAPGVWAVICGGDVGEARRQRRPDGRTDDEAADDPQQASTGKGGAESSESGAANQRTPSQHGSNTAAHAVSKVLIKGGTSPIECGTATQVSMRVTSCRAHGCGRRHWRRRRSEEPKQLGHLRTYARHDRLHDRCVPARRIINGEGRGS